MQCTMVSEIERKRDAFSNFEKGKGKGEETWRDEGCEREGERVSYCHCCVAVKEGTERMR